MNNGKWYIKYNRADGEKYSVVYLTDTEYMAVCKFLNNSECIKDDGWCGSCRISIDGYATKEEAIVAIEG